MSENLYKKALKDAIEKKGNSRSYNRNELITLTASRLNSEDEVIVKEVKKDGTIEKVDYAPRKVINEELTRFATKAGVAKDEATELSAKHQFSKACAEAFSEIYTSTLLDYIDPSKVGKKVIIGNDHDVKHHIAMNVIDETESKHIIPKTKETTYVRTPEYKKLKVKSVVDNSLKQRRRG